MELFKCYLSLEAFGKSLMRNCVVLVSHEAIGPSGFMLHSATVQKIQYRKFFGRPYCTPIVNLQILNT